MVFDSQEAHEGNSVFVAATRPMQCPEPIYRSRAKVEHCVSLVRVGRGQSSGLQTHLELACRVPERSMLQGRNRRS